MEILIKSSGKVIVIPDTIINVWVVVLALSIFAFIVNKKIKEAKADEVPSNFLNVVELLVGSLDGLIASTMGKQNVKRFGPFILTLTLFLAVANLLGLVGLASPTSDYSVTLSLALVTFALTQFWTFKNNKGVGGYVKSFGQPSVLLSPLNIIGELANPVSLSFRLFGNIMSGGIILTLVYSGFGYIAPILAIPLHAYFDIFSGLLQTFIFIMLSMVFIEGAAE